MANETLLRLDVRRPGPGTVVVAVYGEVDLLTARDLELGLQQHVPAAAMLVVDLSEVRFFGAAGLEVLVRVQAQAQRRGSAVRLVVGPHLRRLLNLADLECALPVHDAR